MAKDDLYNRLFGINPPTMTLSKLLEMHAPPEPPNAFTTLSKLLGNYAPPAPHATTLSQLMGLATPAAPVPAPTGIWFSERYFSEPMVFDSASLPSCPGIYAILVFDWTSKPRPYRVLYFGKAADLSERVVRSHEKYGEWCRAAIGAGPLYVAYRLMRNTSDGERATLEERLIKDYSPVCNKTFNPFAGLFGS